MRWIRRISRRLAELDEYLHGSRKAWNRIQPGMPPAALYCYGEPVYIPFNKELKS